MTLDSLRALREAATPPKGYVDRDAEYAFERAADKLVYLAPCLVDALIEAHEALRFYADETNWTQMASWGGRIHDDESEVIVDYGSIARAAVARIDTLDKNAETA